MIVYNLTLNHFGFTKHQNQIHENLAVKNDAGLVLGHLLFSHSTGFAPEGGHCKDVDLEKRACLNVTKALWDDLFGYQNSLE